MVMSLGLCVCTSCEQKPSPEEAIQQLSAMGINFKHYEKSLFQAIASNNVHVVKMLLAAGTNVHALNQEELTPLMVAVLGREEMVPLLLDYGADVNYAPSDRPVRPLLLAAWYGSPTIVKMLLDEGASVNVSLDGLTALHISMLDVEDYPYKEVSPIEDPRLRAEVVELLIDHGANVNVSARIKKEGITPLHCAAERGNTMAMRHLIKAGANIDALDEDDETPLYKATRKEHVSAVKLLLDSGANVNAGQKELLTEAAEHRNWEIVDLLLEAGAKK